MVIKIIQCLNLSLNFNPFLFRFVLIFNRQYAGLHYIWGPVSEACHGDRYFIIIPSLFYK